MKYREELSDDFYQRHFSRFAPDLYDPALWARAARVAGMKYVVVTASHHEGFCLWDWQFTGYEVLNTAYAKNALRPFIDVFHAEGLRIGFYYSLLDWHHPEFPIDGQHPQRNLPNAAEINRSRDVRRYAEYMRNQVRELLTQYGRIDLMWFDFSYPDFTYRGLPGKGRNDWESEKLITLARELQPGILINNQLYLHIFNWPFKWIYLDGMAGRIEYAQMLHDASEVPVKSVLRNYDYEAITQYIPEDTAVPELPVKKPDVVVPVIEIFLKE